MSHRKICVVTGSRAEYGLLYWLLKEIETDASLELQLIVTGMHLSPEFGMTCRQIETDGFCIDSKVEMLLSSDTAVGIAKSMGLGTIGFADAFDRLRPDILVLLGDRFEILAAAQAALVARIPIAHIHGGELTEGAFDESIRHAITKMANLHFVAAEPYRRRVIQLGEQPERVFTVGAPGIDNIHRLSLLDRGALEKQLDFDLGKITFLVTYHPVTLGELQPSRAMEELLAALDRFTDAHIVATFPNADTSGRVLIEQLQAYAQRWSGRVLPVTSLGQLRYLSLMRAVDVVIGNSSSGLIEAPSFRVPTVNLGNRQGGRLRAASVIDCAEQRDSIAAAIERALSPEFRDNIKDVTNPYGDSDAARRMLEQLRSIKLEELCVKRFYDLPTEGAPS